MREIGASDAYIYYANSGKAGSMEIRIPFTLSCPADTVLLEKAATEALTLFPEFAVRPVVCGGKLMFEETCATVRVVTAPDDGSFTVCYGTEDTNSLQFFFLVDLNDPCLVTFCYYHAMSDFMGGMSLLKTVLYRYACLLNPSLSVSDEELRSSGIRTLIPENWHCKENLDPYAFFAREPEIVPAPQVSGTAPAPAFSPDVPLYAWDSEENHIYYVNLSVSDFLRKTRSLGTSFVPLLVRLMAEATDRCFHADDSPVVIALPVDIRRIYGANTIVNFSDAVIFPCDNTLRAKPAQEACLILKQMLEEQRTAAHMDAFLYNKYMTVQGFRSDPAGYAEISDRLHPMPDADAKSPVSFGITYPGKLDLPDFLQDSVCYVGVESVINLSPFFVIVSTYGDQMVIQMVQRFDGSALADTLSGLLKEAGIDSGVTDHGIRKRNRLDPRKLKTVSEA